MSADMAMQRMHRDLFAAMGVDAMVTRASAEAVRVRVVVNRGLRRLGEYGQVVGRADGIDFLAEQWRPQQGDVVTWTDHMGANTRTVALPDDDDGFVAKAVLRG